MQRNQCALLFIIMNQIWKAFVQICQDQEILLVSNMILKFIVVAFFHYLTQIDPQSLYYGIPSSCPCPV